MNKGPTTSQFKELAEIHFPGCTSVAYAPPFLVVSWKELPMKPWPLTVGGFPLYYAKQTYFIPSPNGPVIPEYGRPPTFGKTGINVPMMKEAAHQLNDGVYPGNLFIKRLTQLFVEQGVGLIFLGWSGMFWYAEVTSLEDGTKLPSTICNRLLMWKVYPHNAWARLQLHMADSILFFDGDEVNDIELNSNKIDVPSSFYFHSPNNGKCEGIVVSKGIRILPAQQNELCRYNECIMVYFGNGTNQIIHGTWCRSAL